MNKNKRDLSIDYARGVFIALMIIFHVFQNFSADWRGFKSILDLLTPITFSFAFLSGLTLIKFGNDKPYSYLIKKSLKLLILFVIFNAIRVLYEPSSINFKQIFELFTLGAQQNFSFSIIFALSFITLFFPILKRAPILFLIIISVPIIILSYYNISAYNFEIYISFILGIFVGKNLKSYIKPDNKILIWLTLAIVLPNQGYFSVYSGCSYALIFIWLYKYLPKNKYISPSPLIKLSLASLFVYFAHISLIKFVNVLFPLFVTQDTLMLLLIGLILIVVFTAIAYCIDYLLRFKVVRKVYKTFF